MKEKQTMGEEELVGVAQGHLGAKVDKEQERKRLELMEEGDTEEMARLKSRTLLHPGDWINVVQSSALGLHLRLQEFGKKYGRYTGKIQVFVILSSFGDLVHIQSVIDLFCQTAQ